MKLSKVYAALCVATTPVMISAVAVADVQTTELNEIQVVAGRDPIQWANYANPSEILNPSALLKQQPGSVAEALKYLNNVEVQGGSRAIAQKPTIRGLGGNRVVQVIDGVRQNFDLEHRGSYLLPPALMQEVAVIKGPAGSLWGSGALGGVVAVRTPGALDLLRDNQTFGAKIRQGYQSANRLYGSEASLFMANEKLDALLSGFYNDADDLRLGGGGKQAQSAYRQKGGLAKFGWQINDHHRLEFSHRLSVLNQVAPSNNELAAEFTFADLTKMIANCYRNPAAKCDMPKIYAEMGSVSYLTKQQITDQSTALNYYLDPKDNPYLNTQFTLYRNSTVEKEARIGSEIRDQTKLSTLGFNLRNSSDFGGVALTYGVDYYQDHGRSERGTDKSDAYRADPYNVKSKVSGIYLLAHLPLFEKTVILSPSVRYDHYQTQNQQGKFADYRDARWSPALALTWKATNWLNLNARYTEAFRAPSIQERYSSGSHFGTAMGQRNAINTFVENPNLKPETAQNKEISADIHFENLLTANDKATFTATYFQNDVKNLINLDVYSSNPRSPFPNLSQYRNVADARLNGIELAAHYQTERFGLSANYAQTRGKDKHRNEPLANIPANKFSVAANYAVIADVLDMEAGVTRYQAQKRIPSTQTAVYNGYTLTDIRFGYRPLGKTSPLRLDIAVENLFDKKHQAAFSLMEGAGRNLKANVSYTF